VSSAIERADPAVPTYVTIRRSAPEALEAAIRSLIANGKGWVNLRPDIPEDDLPPVPSTVSRLFSGRGPAVPMATFVASRGGKAHQVGIEHGSGPKAVRRLADAGVVAPAGSIVKSDHGRRGLVVSVPADAAPDAIARFLLDAASTLSNVFIGGEWEAEIFES
jgi:hypothetical protein